MTIVEQGDSGRLVLPAAQPGEGHRQPSDTGLVESSVSDVDERGEAVPETEQRFETPIPRFVDVLDASLPREGGRRMRCAPVSADLLEHAPVVDVMTAFFTSIDARVRVVPLDRHRRCSCDHLG